MSYYSAGNKPSNKDEVINGLAIFESFLVHTRNLICFFDLGISNVYTTDIVISKCDFFKIESTHRLKECDKQFLKTSYISLNKRLFHLTQERNDRNFYNFRYYVELLLPFIKEFIEQVPNDNKNFFKNTLEIIKEYDNEKIIVPDKLDLEKSCIIYIIPNILADKSEEINSYTDNVSSTLGSGYFENYNKDHFSDNK